MAGRLTDAKIKGMKAPSSGQVEHADDLVPGLRVRVGKSGTKTFILRKRVAGKVRNVTLGRYDERRFGLAEARRKARVYVSDVESGKVPAKPKRTTNAALTIRAMMDDYLATKAHKRSYREIERVAVKYILPGLGDRLADTVTRKDVTELVSTIAERGSPTMARAVHAQLSAFYTWALPALDHIPANPCRDARRPEKGKPRDRVLSDDEIRALWHVAELELPPWGPGLKLLLLTGTRREEVFNANRGEFNFKAKEWIIPEDRTKNGSPHLVPLSSAAVAVVKSLPGVEGSPKLFPTRTVARQADAGPSGYSKAVARIRNALDAELGRKAPHWVLHDLRRTVATGLQRLKVREEVVDAILNHVSGSARSGIRRVYHLHDFKVEKRRALDAWARHLAKIVDAKDNAGER